MKLVRIYSHYSAYIAAFSAAHPDLSAKPYREQKAVLDRDSCAWADFWGNALLPLGYETEELATNFESAQKAWAREHGVRFDGANWQLEIARAQVLAAKPDVLFMNDYSTFGRDWVRSLRADCPSIRLVLGWCGAPYRDASVFEAYDIVLSCVPELVERFRAMGHRSEHVHHAFDPRVLERLGEPASQPQGFTFVGHVVRSGEFHLERERLLERLVDSTDVRIYSPVPSLTLADTAKLYLWRTIFDAGTKLKAVGVPERALARVPRIGKAATWKQRPIYPISPKLRRVTRPAVFGLEMFRTLRSSVATFNSHINISPRSASNMRVFEATGVGTCLVTDWKENLHELFELDREVVAYRSPEECVEKVRWLMSHPSEARAIGEAAQKRTLRDHTFARRTAGLDAIIRGAVR